MCGLRGGGQRVGGLDDQTAIGAQCGSLMLRLDEDLFQSYFNNQDKLPKVSVAAEDGEFLGEKRICGHVYGKPLLLRSAAPRAVFAGAAIPAPIFPKSWGRPSGLADKGGLGPAGGRDAGKVTTLFNGK